MIVQSTMYQVQSIDSYLDQNVASDDTLYLVHY